MFGYGKLNSEGSLISATNQHDDFEELSNFEQDKDKKFYRYYKLEKVDGKYIPNIEKIEEEKVKSEQFLKQQKTERKANFNTKYPLGFTQSISDNLKEYTCPKCRDYEPTLDNIFGVHILKDMYCLRNNIDCIQCTANSSINEQIKMLKMLIEVVKYNAFNEVYKTLGSQTNIGTILMKKNQINDIYFEEMGIPKDANILDMNLTPSGNLFPLKLMSNNPRHMQEINNNIFSFFPSNIFKEIIPSEREDSLSISVQWILFEEDDISDINLLQAMDNYIDNKPLELIMNANRTLELLCNQICFKEFVKDNDSNKGKKSVEDFLVTGATYGHQLNHLLSLICKSNNLTPIEKELISKINWLRKLRNDIAHRGQIKDNRELTKKEKEEILAIAILGSSLMKYIYKKI
ncbi:hypothetical protein SMGD1_2213 [Sulfurimonas gotlandica GD1]|uniref:Apea-like HEPN domain-containing protein n=1 Tax=Sulfurimonas gotlandica (strain DSM 19862 / JCM 16533 / GD1) TaxID=929558 RepID=B6BMY9_SULGG|nr:hypothetical protein [Sulfurimonas gotlandica]EDZ61477.1 hypothetical protein CBGD1_1556 [Sulfurimonas gotlandica GD1]EHP30736.1 hypothetical protein SMGD1_2213 [Sulfurimonas gotlandica GD1]